ncbi:MAG: alpha/beta hydrolase [Flavobacteriales bacterium]|nr:alpha/beta hydrolase [Flavobacteriales bacterium]
MTFIQYQGAPVYYQITGAPSLLPPLVLLHGFLEDSRMWDGMISHFESKGLVVCIDLLGHGKSGSLSSNHSMEKMAETVFAIVHHLELQKPIILGHSMGGYVGLAYAQNYDQLGGLGLFFSTPHADSSERKIMRDRSEKLVRSYKDAFIRTAIPQLFSEELRATCSKQISQQIEYSLEMNVEGVIAAIRGIKIRSDKTPILEQPPQALEPNKIGVFVGETDTIVPFEKTKDWINLPGIGFKFISKHGHMGHISDTLNCTKAVIQWWSSFESKN